MIESSIFTTMGMLIIDEIHFPPSSNLPSQTDVLGGGGTFAALGARIVIPDSQSTQIGWFVDKGCDFPYEIEDYLKNWGTGAIWREDINRLTTRGWNFYHDNEFREFKYLTEKKRITVEDLFNHEALLKSRSYHLICSPSRCLEILEKLKLEREKLGWMKKPIIIWEVVPDLCNVENFKGVKKVLSYIDVFTPNAEEGARLFGLNESKDIKELEELASKFLLFMKGGGVVLRCGSLGCYTITNSTSNWWPAYQNDKNPKRKVIDPTGGGNTFIGAFAVGLVLSGNWDVASVCGNIAAGIAIEQIGMPKFDGKSWNGCSLKERLKRYFEWNEIELNVDSVLKVLGHNLEGDMKIL